MNQQMLQDKLSYLDLSDTVSKKTSRKSSCSVYRVQRDVQGVIYSRQLMTISQQKIFLGQTASASVQELKKGFQAKYSNWFPRELYTLYHAQRGFSIT
jgi:hypothetical protein